MNRIVFFAAASALVVSLAACDREDRDQAVDETSAAIVDAREGVEVAATETKAAVDEGVDKLQQGAAEAGATLKDAGQDMKDAGAQLKQEMKESGAQLKAAASGEPVVQTASASPPGAAPQAFSRCVTCHGPNALPAVKGPDLAGVFNRAIASTDYAHSDGLKAKGEGQRWTEANLEGFLANPREWAPGTKMRTGVADAAQRAEVIAYLRTLK